MSAADNLLNALRAMDEVVDYITSPPAGTPVNVTDALVRSVCVQGLASFEAFVRERSDEWVAYLSSGRIPPSRLPGGSRQYEDRVVQLLPRALQYADTGDRARIIEDVGRTLLSLSTSNLVAHGLAFSWPGSNIRSDDVAALLYLAGVDTGRAWSEMTALWSAVDARFPGNTSAKSLFESFCSLRHNAAHEVTPNLPLANVAAMTRSVKLTSLCLDALVSTGLRAVRLGQAASVRGSGVAVRRIKHDGSEWPEYPPSKTRAIRRHASLSGAILAASSRSAPGAELVVAFEGTEIVDWRFPAV